MNTSCGGSGLVILQVPGPACRRATLLERRELLSATLLIAIMRNHSSGLICGGFYVDVLLVLEARPAYG